MVGTPDGLQIAGLSQLPVAILTLFTPGYCQVTDEISRLWSFCVNLCLCQLVIVTLVSTPLLLVPTVNSYVVDWSNEQPLNVGLVPERTVRCRELLFLNAILVKVMIFTFCPSFAPVSGITPKHNTY